MTRRGSHLPFFRDTLSFWGVLFLMVLFCPQTVVAQNSPIYPTDTTQELRLREADDLPDLTPLDRFQRLREIYDQAKTEKDCALYHRHPETWVGYQALVRERLLAFPAATWTSLSSDLDRGAEQELSQAVERANLAGLKRVKDLYPGLLAGRRAAHFLAQATLERGDGLHHQEGGSHDMGDWQQPVSIVLSETPPALVWERALPPLVNFPKQNPAEMIPYFPVAVLVEKQKQLLLARPSELWRLDAITGQDVSILDIQAKDPPPVRRVFDKKDGVVWNTREIRGVSAVNVPLSVSVSGNQTWGVALLGMPEAADGWCQTPEGFTLLRSKEVDACRRQGQFLCPPTLFHQQAVFPLVSDANGMHRTSVLALNRETLRPAWCVSYGGSPTLKGSGLAAEMLVAQPILSDGGTLYLVDNQGTVAALNGDDGEILWLCQYPRKATVSPGWLMTMPLLRRGTLYIAPMDSDDLMAVEAATGRLLWTHPRKEAHSILGIRDGRIYLQGKGIEAVDLEMHLPPVRSLDIPDGLLSARGLVTLDRILYPCQNRIVLLDRRSLRVCGEWPGIPGGNLCFNFGRLFVLSETAVRAYQVGNSPFGY